MSMRYNDLGNEVTLIKRFAESSAPNDGGARRRHTACLQPGNKVNFLCRPLRQARSPRS